MNFNEVKQNIEKFISNGMKEREAALLPNPENAGYDVFNNAWALVVAVDLRDYKKMVSKYKRWAIIRIIQGFTNTVIKQAKDSKYFVDAYVNGDEVICVFQGNTIEKINEVFGDTVLKINSMINYLFPTLLKENGYEHFYGAGVGIWLSNNNSLVKYGEKSSAKHNFTTTIGDSINFSSKLAKFGKKNGNYEILLNETLWTNLNDENKNWINKSFLMEDKQIYGLSVRYSEYAEYKK
ncbi:MAG: hypothetical protein KAG14_02075 [Mycoplasmataceae bacterium]|nr:hypothetical protein [Mycoplasmataceae bacterium]